MGVAGVLGVVGPVPLPAVPRVSASFVGVCRVDSLFSAVEVREKKGEAFHPLKPTALPRRRPTPRSKSASAKRTINSGLKR